MKKQLLSSVILLGLTAGAIAQFGSSQTTTTYTGYIDIQSTLFRNTPIWGLNVDMPITGFVPTGVGAKVLVAATAHWTSLEPNVLSNGKPGYSLELHCGGAVFTPDWSSQDGFYYWIDADKAYPNVGDARQQKWWATAIIQTGRVNSKPAFVGIPIGGGVTSKERGRENAAMPLAFVPYSGPKPTDDAVYNQNILLWSVHMSAFHATGDFSKTVGGYAPLLTPTIPDPWAPQAQVQNNLSSVSSGATQLSADLIDQIKKATQNGPGQDGKPKADQPKVVKPEEEVEEFTTEASEKDGEPIWILHVAHSCSVYVDFDGPTGPMKSISMVVDSHPASRSEMIAVPRGKYDATMTRLVGANQQPYDCHGKRIK